MDLVLKNMRLVYKIANKYPKHCKLPLEDRVQEGFIGLIRAAREYDESKKVPFGTFAGQHIQWAISNALRNQNPVKVSTDVTQLIAHITKHGLENLSVEELMARTKETRTVVKQALSFMKTEFESLDFGIKLHHGGMMENHESIGREDDFDTRLVLDEVLSEVPEDVQQFLKLSNQGYTLEEIAEMYGRTWRHVQYHMRATKKKLQARRAELIEA